MTPLRQQMIDAMTQRGFSPRTHQAYLANISDLARYTHCSPDRLSPAQLADYFRHLAVALAGIDKQGGIHALRHAYATHQIAAGMPIHTLKEILGHHDLHSTERYVHWVPNAPGNRPITDLLEDIDYGRL